MTPLLQRVLEGRPLTYDEMADCMTQMLSGKANPAQIAGLLTALRVRGETVEELAGAASAVRAMATPVKVRAPIVVDTCGTGGDSKGTFNISTAAAIVASACGVTVAKHGNRSVSSKCGSADVLEALGVRLDVTAQEQQEIIALSRLGFLFAPAHHPAFKHVAAIRRELGVRTLFNLVGPLANPAGANRQVMGVFDPRLVPLMGQVLARLGTERAVVVHGGGLDEVSVCGPTSVTEVRGGERVDFTLTPEALGLRTSSLDALVGGDAAHNARMLSDVLRGQRGAPRDAVLANAAAALYVADAVGDLRGGVRLAARVLDSGAALAHFERFVRIQGGQRTMLDDIIAALPAPGGSPDAEDVITSPNPVPTSGRRATLADGPRAVARAEPPTRGPTSLRAALSPRGGPTRIIAEVKRRSPSAGLIADIPDPGALARAYEKAGAAAISVLTNRAHFGGALADLAAVRQAVAVPVLRKDFITDPRQLDEAVEVGASAVLLIVAVLGPGLKGMLRAAHDLGLDALVEVHDEAELAVALEADALLVGVNNRDLRTFKVDLGASERIAALTPPQVTLVAESGIKAQADIERLRAAGISNFLVGEFLVRGGQLT